MSDGILTEADWETLNGENDDISERALEQRKIRVRRRLRQMIIELGSAGAKLSAEDRKRIFLPPANTEHDDNDMTIATGHLFSLAYLGLKEEHREHYKENVREIVANAESRWSVQKTGRRDDPEVKFRVSHNVEEKSLDDLADRFRDGEEMGEDEIFELIQARRIGGKYEDIELQDLIDELDE